MNDREEEVDGTEKISYRKDSISANTIKSQIASTYKVKRHFFRHGRRTAPKLCTHVRIETRLALT